MQTCIQTERQTYPAPDRQPASQPARPAGRQTGTQTDRQTDRQTEIFKGVCMYFIVYDRL